MHPGNGASGTTRTSCTGMRQREAATSQRGKSRNCLLQRYASGGARSEWSRSEPGFVNGSPQFASDVHLHRVESQPEVLQPVIGSRKYSAKHFSASIRFCLWGHCRPSARVAALETAHSGQASGSGVEYRSGR
jgi:hypothetical protein